MGPEVKCVSSAGSGQRHWAAVGRRPGSAPEGNTSPPPLPTHLPALFSLPIGYPFTLLPALTVLRASSVTNGRVRSGEVGSESTVTRGDRQVQVTLAPQNVMIKGIVPPKFSPGNDKRSVVLNACPFRKYVFLYDGFVLAFPQRFHTMAMEYQGKSNKKKGNWATQRPGIYILDIICWQPNEGTKPKV